MSKSVQNAGIGKPKVDAGSAIDSSSECGIQVGVGVFVLHAGDTTPDAGAFIVGKRLGSLGVGECSLIFLR